MANINLMEKGSDNHAYQVMNRAGDVIGEINIFQNPESVGGLENYKYNLKALIPSTDNADDDYKWSMKESSQREVLNQRPVS